MAKKDIHPDYFQTIITNTTTGETMAVGSTKKDIKVDIFLKDHPFMTGKTSSGKQDGRVERFKKKFANFKK